jgi:hypothetical protein
MTLVDRATQVADAALENLRQTSFVPFWKPAIYVTPCDEMAGVYDEARTGESRVKEILKEALSRRSFKTFLLELRDRERDHYGIQKRPSVAAALRDGSEWDQVFEEAWAGVENANESCLTDNALRLLNWIRGPKNPGSLVPVNKVGAQAGIRGTGSYALIRTFLEEIAFKCPYELDFEVIGSWSDRRVRAKLHPKRSEKRPAKHDNPVFSGKILGSDRSDWEAYARMVEDRVLCSDLDDESPCVLFSIHSRTELVRCLPNLKDREDAEPGALNDFLEKVRLARGLRVGSSLEDRAGAGWVLGAVLEKGWTWDRAMESIRERRNRQDPRTTYGLSGNAAKILEWIWSLHDHEMEMDMTPPVEPAARERIGMERLGSDPNSRAVLELMIEEINERTPYLLRLIPWKDYARDYHRILVRKKSNREDDLVREIQILGIEKGVCVEAADARAALEGLWNPPVSASRQRNATPAE